jgi:endonuclease/exonuclease/phosphatase (EEP) superfamily protein YafD
MFRRNIIPSFSALNIFTAIRISNLKSVVCFVFVFDTFFHMFTHSITLPAIIVLCSKLISMAPRLPWFFRIWLSVWSTVYTTISSFSSWCISCHAQHIGNKDEISWDMWFLEFNKRTVHKSMLLLQSYIKSEIQIAYGQITESWLSLDSYLILCHIWCNTVGVITTGNGANFCTEILASTNDYRFCLY